MLPKASAMPTASPKKRSRATTGAVPTLCLVCSERRATTKGRCGTCARYFKRNGFDRPVRLTERQRDTDSAMRLLMRPGDASIITLEDLLARPAWHTRAACHDASLDLFVLGPYQSPRPGLALCEGCEVRVECLDFAMADPNLEGTWGGTTTRQRRTLRQAAS